MMQRHQRILFWCLMACILAMAVLLFAERQRGRESVLALGDQTPLDVSSGTAETVTMDLANDADGSIRASQREIALPVDRNARIRALLDRLIAQYAQAGSAHPLHPGGAVGEVYLLPLPVVGYTQGTTPSALHPDHRASVMVAPTAPLQPSTPGGELAVIDLRGSFADQHPSGVEVESLTLLSMIGTLHANVPEIEQIRFLVDGAQRETLAGHIDLLKTYASRDTTTQPISATGDQP